MDVAIVHKKYRWNTKEQHSWHVLVNGNNMDVRWRASPA